MSKSRSVAAKVRPTPPKIVKPVKKPGPEFVRFVHPVMNRSGELRTIAGRGAMDELYAGTYLGLHGVWIHYDKKKWFVPASNIVEMGPIEGDGGV